MQAYLNSGMVEWWTHKHAITSPHPSPRVGEFIRMKVDFVNVLVCKVGSALFKPTPGLQAAHKALPVIYTKSYLDCKYCIATPCKQKPCCQLASLSCLWPSCRLPWRSLRLLQYGVLAAASFCTRFLKMAPSQQVSSTENRVHLS